MAELRTVDRDNFVRRQRHWDDQYQAGGLPWETGRPSSELQRVLTEYRVQPGRAVEIGCGTGASSVWLAERGFEVMAVDLSPVAIQRARCRARRVGVKVNFHVGDAADSAVFEGRFDFFFDRGCYHAVRRASGVKLLESLDRITRPGALGLVLMGNAAEPEDDVGPPVLEGWQARAEWSEWFSIIHLRRFYFDPRREGDKRYLGWSCLLRKAVDGHRRHSAGTHSTTQR